MKDILLTIDDGPSADTRHLVDFLGAKEIPAILFFIGQNMEKYPDEVDYAIQSGVSIGNHTYSHPALSKLSLEDGIQEIRKTEEIIETAYKRNSRARACKLFRFPFLDTGAANRSGIMKYLLENGFERVQSGFVTHKWFDEYRMEPHVGGTFYCFDWELPNNTEKFGIPEMLEKLHSGEGENIGSIFSGDSGEIFVIHDLGWKTKKNERHYEIIVEELDKAKVSYLEPVFF